MGRPGSGLRSPGLRRYIITYLVEEPSTLDPAWLEGKKSVCITAGASTPEDLVQDVVEKLREYASLRISAMDGIVEDVHFGLPVGLQPPVRHLRGV